MTRRDFLACAGPLAGRAQAARAMQAQRPNIVFIYADDLDFDEIGCYDL